MGFHPNVYYVMHHGTDIYKRYPHSKSVASAWCNIKIAHAPGKSESVLRTEAK